MGIGAAIYAKIVREPLRILDGLEAHPILDGLEAHPTDHLVLLLYAQIVRCTARRTRLLIR